MSQKFIGLDAAAEQLGITKERLNEIRESGDLRAYRDGASWKFRTEEIDNLVGSELLSGDASSASDAPLELDMDDQIELGVEPLAEGDDAESILLTEGELEGGLPRPPSTIIGKSELSDDDDLSLKPAVAEGDSPEEAPLGPSLESGSVEGESSETSGAFEDLEELELDLEAESSRLLDSGEAAEVHGALSISDESVEGSSLGDAPLEEELDLELDGGSASGTGASDVMGADVSPSALSGTPGSVAGLSGIDSVEVSDDDMDDMVLGDSGDLSLAGSDSGINLAPSDSGIALDEVPLDLAGSAIGSALDLASLSASVQESVPAAGDSDQVGSDVASGEEFLLTPTSDSGSKEDSSQVVALEEFQEAAAGEDPSAISSFGAASDEDVGIGFESAEEGSLGGDFAAVGASAAVGAAPAAMGTPTADATFPVWILALLGSSLLTMALCGLMALDLMQSMWSWDEPFAINSALMDQLIGLLGG